MGGDERRLTSHGRRKGDGPCLMHGPLCKEVDNLRSLFLWGSAIIVTVFLAVMGLGVSALDKLHDSIAVIDGDVKVIKYRIERDYSVGRHSRLEFQKDQTYGYNISD